MTSQGAVEAILKELYRAQKKFPEWPTDPIHAASILGEESGELTRAALQYTYEKGSTLDMMDEAIHTGAMAVRFLMSIEKYTPIESPQERQNND